MRCAEERETARSSGRRGCRVTRSVPRSLTAVDGLSPHHLLVQPDTEREVAVQDIIDRCVQHEVCIYKCTCSVYNIIEM